MQRWRKSSFEQLCEKWEGRHCIGWKWELLLGPVWQISDLPFVVSHASSRITSLIKRELQVEWPLTVRESFFTQNYKKFSMQKNSNWTPSTKHCNVPGFLGFKLQQNMLCLSLKVSLLWLQLRLLEAFRTLCQKTCSSPRLATFLTKKGSWNIFPEPATDGREMNYTSTRYKVSFLGKLLLRMKNDDKVVFDDIYELKK